MKNHSSDNFMARDLTKKILGTILALCGSSHVDAAVHQFTSVVCKLRRNLFSSVVVPTFPDAVFVGTSSPECFLSVDENPTLIPLDEAGAYETPTLRGYFATRDSLTEAFRKYATNHHERV